MTKTRRKKSFVGVPLERWLLGLARSVEDLRRPERRGGREQRASARGGRIERRLPLRARTVRRSQATASAPAGRDRGWLKVSGLSVASDRIARQGPREPTTSRGLWTRHARHAWPGARSPRPKPARHRRARPPGWCSRSSSCSHGSGKRMHAVVDGQGQVRLEMPAALGDDYIKKK